MNQSQVAALMEMKWTFLKSLHIEPQDKAVPELLHRNLPELTELSVNSSLSDQGLAHLCAGPWST